MMTTLPFISSFHKGSYEGSAARYKHIYFNCTWNTFLIYAMVVATMLISYETTKNLVKLVTRQHARVSMVTLMALSVYPHYYTLWSYFNAYNDDFYEQFWHQAVFSVTEVLSSVCVYQMCNSQMALPVRKLLVVINIAVFHIMASAMDQFVVNVIQSGGQWHQFSRDLSFMVIDFVHLIVSSWHLLKLSRKSVMGFKSEMFYSVITTCFLIAVSRIL